MSGKSTPGPWRRGQKGNLRIYGPDSSGPDSGLIAYAVRACDINLLTAAPDLKEALEQAQQYILLAQMDAWNAGKKDLASIAKDHLQKASAALARANGDSQ